MLLKTTSYNSLFWKMASEIDACVPNFSHLEDGQTRRLDLPLNNTRVIAPRVAEGVKHQ